MKICTLILLFTTLSFSALSKDTDVVLDNKAVKKEQNNLEYGGGIGASFYDTIEGESKAFRGNIIYFSWQENSKKSRLTLRESAHGLQVLTSVNTKQAQRNWDLEYSWDEYGYSNQVIDLYLSPMIGGKVKEELTVKCRETDRVCFDSFIDDWKITDKKQELRPLLGLQTGIRIKRFHVVINPQIFLKTDFENTYYGIEITLGGEQ
jgi:hypothetical protein